MRKIKNIALRVIGYITLTALIVVLSSVNFSDASGPRIFRKGSLVDKIISVLYAHHELHNCMSFTTVRNEPSLATGGTLKLLFNTPASTPTDAKDIHMLIVARGSAEGRYDIWKNPTITSIGTAMREEKRRQKCTNEAELEVTHTPTISDPGILLEGFTRHFGAGQVQGGESRGLEEINLDNDTLYFINGVSEANNNDFTIEPNWYRDTGDAP